jgi:two-component system LytT family response regulator
MRAILVDDEYSNRVLLCDMLKANCPEVEVVATADSADTAFLVINQLKPDLVFLDIKMPDKNGFDLLRMFESISFSVIFVTGFDQYALKAFEFNALDYVLKPIDYTKLISAVKKAKKHTHANLGNIIHFVHSMEEKTNYVKKLTLHIKDKVHIVELNDIVYFAANRGYCEIMDVKNNRYISAKTLSDYEELILPLQSFIRVSKSHIINIQHLKSYTKGAACIISMKNCNEEIEVSLRKKTQVLAFLKAQSG